MNYLNLPPGLRRRMTYSNFLDTRRRNNILAVYNTPVLSITPIRRNYRENHINNYEFFSSLQNVKIGLISKNLIVKSRVKNCEIPDNLCVICQDDIEIDSIVREIECSHEFHIDCIDNWFTENKKCPICNFEL